jgi:hypothetical protein
MLQVGGTIILIPKSFKMADADPLFHDSLIKAGWRHLYWKKDVKTFPCQKEDIVTFMNLEALERMNLHFLRKQLLDDVANYIFPKSKTDDMAKKVSESLHQYCKLVPTVQLVIVKRWSWIMPGLCPCRSTHC